MLLLATSVKLRIAPLAFIWRNPYRIYILHQPLLIALGALMPGAFNSWAGFAVTTIACLAILRMVSLLLDSEGWWLPSFHSLGNSANAQYRGKA